MKDRDARFLASIALLFAVSAFLLIVLHTRHLADRLDMYECTHFVFEDGSTIHQDAELARECMILR
jgi:hypothetical protein